MLKKETIPIEIILWMNLIQRKVLIKLQSEYYRIQKNVFSYHVPESLNL